MAENRDTQFDIQETLWEDEETKQRIEERRRINNRKRRKKKFLTLLILIGIFALLGSMCGKDIVRLKAENRALRKQQIALEKQRDELQEELKNANDQEYIREQAKKQLRLLNPGEILFTFDEEDTDEAAKDGKDDKSKKSDKAGDSDE